MKREKNKENDKKKNAKRGMKNERKDLNSSAKDILIVIPIIRPSIYAKL